MTRRYFPGGKWAGKVQVHVVEFPEIVDRSPPEIRELYAFAARRPDVMHYVPCYCGCGGIGHESAYDCYIDEVRPDGTVDIDNMAFT